MLNFAHRPGLVEIGLLGSVEPQIDKEGLPFIGLNPVRFLAFGRLWPEVEVNRSIRVLDEPFGPG